MAIRGASLKPRVPFTICPLTIASMLAKRSKIVYSHDVLLFFVIYVVGSYRLLVMVGRVGRVTECGGEVGRLNVVGGAEVFAL